jgi:hypothetical protein
MSLIKLFLRARSGADFGVPPLGGIFSLLGDGVKTRSILPPKGGTPKARSKLEINELSAIFAKSFQTV